MGLSFQALTYPRPSPRSSSFQFDPRSAVSSRLSGVPLVLSEQSQSETRSSLSRPGLIPDIPSSSQLIRNKPHSIGLLLQAQHRGTRADVAAQEHSAREHAAGWERAARERIAAGIPGDLPVSLRMFHRPVSLLVPSRPPLPHLVSAFPHLVSALLHLRGEQLSSAAAAVELPDRKQEKRAVASW